MLRKLERIIFLAIILFFPIQLGKHFWLPFSYVNGIRVDYLSPTLYVTDILIFLLILLLLFELSREPFNITQDKRSFRKLLDSTLFRSKNILLMFFILYLIVSSFFAKSPEAAIFGVIKFLEFSFLGFYVAMQFKKQYIKPFIYIISIGAILSSFIAFLQFFQQHSIGGVLYFLGERTFNSSTPGIANMDLNGTLVLRPYATFPHPNVLAFFLFLTNIFLIQRFFIEKNQRRKYWHLLVLMLSTTVLFLTFSRIIIVLFIISFFIILIQNTRRKLLIIVPAAVVCLIVYFLAFSYRFFDSAFLLKDWLLRWDLMEISFSIFKQYPIFGIGLNNFFVYESFYQKTITPTLLQPVHNIYILTLVEIGIVGFLFLMVFLIKTFNILLRNTKKIKDLEVENFYRSTLFIFIAMLIVGLFDHFFLTVQQGQFMFALVLGLAWTKMR